MRQHSNAGRFEPDSQQASEEDRQAEPQSGNGADLLRNVAVSGRGTRLGDASKGRLVGLLTLLRRVRGGRQPCPGQQRHSAAHDIDRRKKPDGAAEPERWHEHERAGQYSHDGTERVHRVDHSDAAAMNQVR